MKVSFGKIFGASFLASILAYIVLSLILMLIFFGIIGSLAVSGEGDETKVFDSTVLHITFDDPIIERGNDKEFDIDFATFEPKKRLGLNDILANIERASTDERIEGIFLDLAGISASPSTLQEIRDALVEFQASEKWIVAFSEGYSQATYFIASAADEVYLYPTGDLQFSGLYTELSFFKGMLDRLGVDVTIVRGPDNKYKSAVEPFMYDKMSASNREQMEVLLGEIWGEMLSDISASRSVSVAELNEIADNLAIRSADDAVDYKLVDAKKYRDEVIALLEAKVGVEADADSDDETEEKKSDVNKKKLRFVQLDKYAKAKVSSDKPFVMGADKVAVIYAVGAIESGEGDDQTIGSTRIAKALREARKDDKVKAVVLRVNSPGGSALASDVIWRETQLIKEAGKPLVVSMGDLAASGGYYISAGADYIYATPTTITGSIGVFGMIPNAERMFNEKLGITFDRVHTNEHPGVLTTTRALDEVEFEAINEQVSDIYYDFIGLVAEGRGMEVNEVDSIAQGRVWTGVHAKEIGLVDGMGSLSDAIDKAAELAELTDYRVKSLPEIEDPFQKL
ncbi:MAG: protease-4, partial [Flavobacteriales bacterium]